MPFSEQSRGKDVESVSLGKKKGEAAPVVRSGREAG